MRTREFLTVGVCIVVGTALPAWAQVQAPGVPKGAVKLTSVFPSGSGPDVVARLIADKLQARWGNTVIVEPKPGGAGVVAVNAMKGQPPTGNDQIGRAHV